MADFVPAAIGHTAFYLHPVSAIGFKATFYNTALFFLISLIYCRLACFLPLKEPLVLIMHGV
jgi:hypothetical protein